MASIRIDGKDYLMQEGESVLAALIRHNLKPPHSCRRGTCLSCLSQVVSGDIPERAQQVLLRSQREKGLFLPCVCYPKNDIEILLAPRAGANHREKQ